MALPSSGQISISQIRTELSSSSGSLRTLSAAAGKSTPDSMSEFWGYSAYTAPSVATNGGATVTGSGTQASPYVFSFGTLTGVEDYSIYDYSECCGCYYIYKSNNVAFSFSNNFAGAQKSVFDVTAGSWFGPSTSASCTGYTDYAVYYSSPGSNTYGESSGDGTAMDSLRNSAPTTSSTFTISVGSTISAGFVFDNVVDQNAGDWGVTGLKISVYFIPA